MSELVQFPPLLTEHEAAERLTCSVHTLRRLRQQGRIGYVLIASRPRYRESHLIAYLEARDVKPCKSGVTAPAKSATTGYPSGPTRPSGAAHGLMSQADRQAAHRLALTILQPPVSPSPNGSRSTGTGRRSNRKTC